jgi:hypothetical protein
LATTTPAFYEDGWQAVQNVEDQNPLVLTDGVNTALAGTKGFFFDLAMTIRGLARFFGCDGMFRLCCHSVRGKDNS